MGHQSENFIDTEKCGESLGTSIIK